MPASTAASAVPCPPPGTCFFLDVDGTLVELAARPSEVRAPAGLKALLGRLRDFTGGAVALVSGRALEDLDRLFAPLPLAIAGQHGLERRDAAGRVRAHTADPAPLAAAARRLDAFVRGRAGLEMEHKGLSLALHWRRAPSLGDAARAVMARELTVLGAAWRMQEGKMVCEILAAGHDKGSAIEAFMREAPFRGRLPVFAGDDLTDEAGFAAVNALGGMTVRVGPGTTCAHHVLADVKALRCWVAAWLAAQAPRGAST